MKYNFCPNCGFKLEENFKFCPNCGVELGGAEHSRQPEQPSRGYAERDYEYSRTSQTAPSSSLEKAKMLFRDKDYNRALSYLIEFANTDDIEILYMIGYCLYMTKKFDPNCEKFLRLAADQGHPLAQGALGELYYALAEENSIADFDRGYDPYSGISRERYEESKSKCEMFYSLALKYLNLAKNNGVK
ncbi:MAG: zinc ribbon domain-containing protein [Anaeroplasmataceae bacterium]|nr:zinc ribbon domain-containing protein [Anaeroplasmataceae bacterium]